MGHYTDVVVHVSILEEDDAQDELRLLPELQSVARFSAVPDFSHFYAGTTKGSHIDAILKGIGAIKWEYPEDVQVWYRDEHDETFRLVMGVEEQDKRIVARDDLLNEAQDWLEDLEKIYDNQRDAQGNYVHGWELGQVRGWLERYKELRGKE
jgi:hypothetical protein